MPSTSCFFCRPAKNKWILLNPLPKEAVPLKCVADQCEAVFGVKASKLEEASFVDAFNLFYLTGFNNIYGITRVNFDAREKEEVVQVKHLENLNNFLMAKTIEEKKSLFLNHSKLFIHQFLEHSDISDAQCRALKPALDYVMQQFELSSKTFLFDRLKDTVTKKRRALRIEHLKALSSNITQLLHIAMAIDKVIQSKEPLESSLEKILKSVEQFKMSEKEALRNDGQLFSKQEAIKNTLTLWVHPDASYNSSI